MAMSSGTRIRRRVISWSSPSAIRSLAQKAAVGRDRAGIFAIAAPARDVRAPRMACRQQVGNREIAAEHVIDGYRALAARRGPAVDQDDRGAALLQQGQPLVGLGAG